MLRYIRLRTAGSHETPYRRPELLLPGYSMDFRVELEREDDGRWIAEVPDLPGVLTYGQTREEAVARVQALALRVIAERLEHSEAAPEFLHLSFLAA